MPFKRTARHRAVRLAAGAALVAVSALAYGQDAFQQGLDAYLKGEYRQALEVWKPAAEAGDRVSAFNVGVLYAQGLGVEADPVEAIRWYRRSALAGYANAQFNLGAAYYNGQGTKVNLAQAASWWQRAADQDHPEALYNLATLYRRGHGVDRDIDRAASLFKRAASLGDARARSALAELAAQNPEPASGGEAKAGDPGSTAAGGESANQAAAPKGGTGSLAKEDPGRWTVQVFAGARKDAALKFARDHDLAGRIRIYEALIDGKTWFKGIYGSYPDRAAAQVARAGLAKQLPGASPWVRSFKAIQAEAVAETAAPSRLPEKAAAGAGAGGTKSAKSAASPKKARQQVVPPAPEAPAREAPAAESSAPPANAGGGGDESGETASAGSPVGDDRAALHRGQQAFNAQNYKKAFEAWRPLAEKGVPEAQYGIGFMYESGWGVERDYDKAFRWYQLAAQQGHVKSQFNLGMLYRNGQGVAQNEALGLYWIQTAADRGDERAVSYLKDLN